MNGEDKEDDESQGECEGNLREENAVNTVEDLVRIKFEDLTADEVGKYHFCDREMAFMFYNWYASKHGFSGRKCRIFKSSDGEILQQTFVCHRQGVRVVRSITEGVKKRASRPNSRCGCEAKMQVHVDSTGLRWYVRSFFDVHNHTFLDDKFKGMLPAHRKMSEYDKYQMTVMRDAGIKTSNIYSYAAEQVGGFEKVGYIRKDMYNEQAKQRRRYFSDAQAAMDYLAGLAADDSDMFFRHTFDEDGRLRNLFWCDGISRKDYLVFGDVVAFDATYKKVKYLSPFVVFSGVNHHNQSVVFAVGIVGDEGEATYIWMLEQFLEAMGGKIPVSVITDGDGRMKSAIAKVFPTAHHRLCAWHLLRNAATNVKDVDFLPKLKHCMFGDMDTAEFNRKWEEMVEEFDLEENEWILDLYRRRNMWASSFCRGKFFAGFRTTSRCEGLNSQFGRYVSVLSNLLEFVKHFFKWVELMRHNEFVADYESTTYVEPVIETQYRSLEKSGASLYTKEIHKIFLQFLRKASNCFVRASRNDGSVYFYDVGRYDNDRVQWEVSFCEVSLKFKCSCLRYESIGVPCEHLICVFLNLGIKQIPECLVLKRWTRFAKDGLVYPSSNKRARPDADMLSDYVSIIERCKRMATLAIGSGRPEFRRKLLEFIGIYTGFFEGAERGQENVFPTPDPYKDGTMKNPVKGRTRGCGSSQKKKGKTPKKKVTCTSCGKKGHNRKTCELYRALKFSQQSQAHSAGLDEDEMDSDEFDEPNIDMVSHL